MTDVIQKLLSYLTYHSFIKEALIEDGQIVKKFDDPFIEGVMKEL